MASPSVPKQSCLVWIDAAGIGACLLASLIGYLTLVGPFLQQRSAAGEQRRDLEARQKDAAELKAALTTAQERLDSLRQELAAGAIQLESTAHVNRRIAGLTGLFAGCALHVDDVQTGSVANGWQYDLVPITIVGRGAYQQCAGLLRGLCADYPDMSVVCLELAGNPAQGAEAGKFRIELFWYAAPSGLGHKRV